MVLKMAFRNTVAVFCCSVTKSRKSFDDAMLTSHFFLKPVSIETKLSQHNTKCHTLTGTLGDTGTPGGMKTQAMGKSSNSNRGSLAGTAAQERKESKGKAEGSIEAVDPAAHPVLRGPAQPQWREEEPH